LKTRRFIKAVKIKVFLTVFIACLFIQFNKANALEPALVVVKSKAGKIEHVHIEGYANIEEKRKADINTRFYVGSISKVFTAVLTLNLVQSGELELSNEIKYLLSHRSGLPREGDFGYWFSGEFPDRRALRKYLDEATLQFEPGSKTSYSNIAYAKLGLILEETTGIPYEVLLKERVLLPLKLSNTDVEKQPRHLANGYTPKNKMLPSIDRPFAGVGKKIGERWQRDYHDAKAMSPAFGVYSSPRDLMRFTNFLSGEVNTDVLNKRMLNMMRAIQAKPWALGLKKDHIDGVEVYRHDGWFAAHRSHLLFDPARRVAVVVLANADDAKPAIIAERYFRD